MANGRDLVYGSVQNVDVYDRLGNAIVPQDSSNHCSVKCVLKVNTTDKQR